MTKKQLLTVLLPLLCGLQSWGQMGRLYDVDNQLPSSFVNEVFVDHDGLLWGATRNGLFRYDGYQFRIFSKENGSGLRSNYVNCLAQNRQGQMYFGMFDAVQTFDGGGFADVHLYDLDGREVPCYVECFLERSNGEMLVGTSGHGILRQTTSSASGNKAQGSNDKAQLASEAHQVGGVLAQLGTVHDMAEDAKGRVWIVTDRMGVLVWQPAAQKGTNTAAKGKGSEGKIVARYLQDDPLRSSVRRICMDRQGRIYIGTLRQGVIRLDGNKVTPIDGTFNNRFVSAIYCNKKGDIVIGYDGGGLAIYYPKTGAVVKNPYYSNMVDLAQAKVMSITEDNSGNLWLGMLQKGIYMQPASQGGFSYMGFRLGKDNIIGQACVTSTLIDSRGYVWVGTDKDGLYQLSPSFTLVRHYIDPVPATIISLCEDRQGRIWVGSYHEGCGWLDQQGSYHQQRMPLVAQMGEMVSVFGIVSDAKGSLWLATMGNGLLRILPDGSMKVYTTTPEAAEKRQVNSLINDYISQMSLSPDGQRLYLATTMGLCCFDIERESWTNAFGENCLMYGTPIFTTKEFGGRLLFTTNDSLFCFDLLAHHLEPYTVNGEQISRGVASMEIDLRGRLWLSSYHGLCCFDPKTNSVENYFINDGLQSNEFSVGASCVGANGTMVFGGVGGINWFDPAKIAPKEWKASVKLTDFLLGEQSVGRTTRSGHYQVCDTAAIASDRFDLSYRDNTFTIQLSTLTFDTPEHISYIYSINNEAPVRMPPGKNDLTFSHLSPGTYHFSIRAERNNVLTEPRTFTVVVHSPWFRTWWAFCLYTLLVAFAIWQYLRQRSSSEQSRLRLQEHIHAEEMSEAKVRFFMNISHEIRTPMTLIISPLLSLIAQEDDPRRLGIYETIKRNAERILSLINQLMDLRKIDKGMMQMHFSETDLIAFVQDLYTLFQHQAQAKRINFVYQHDDQQLPIWIDRRQFDKVVVNILSNAFKFTPSGGMILLKIERKGNQAVIAVSDNGENIPEDKMQHIFKRFYQTQDSATSSNTGTGIGLDLTQSLVTLHHGTIEARNLNGDEATQRFGADNKTGVEFVVSIPLGKDHLTPEEIMPEEAEAPNTAAAQIWGEQAEDAEVLPNAEQPENELSEVPLGTPKQITIVIAEDDDEILNYLTEQLSPLYSIIPCENGRQALSETLKNQPDLVLTDIMMPVMDGNTLAATLKSNPQTNHIPICMITALNRDEDKLQGLETGVDAYIVKPFNMDILRRTIDNLINSRRMLQLKYGRNDQLESQVKAVEMLSPDEKLMQRIMKVVNENLANSDLSVDTIASMVGISRVHLHRKMKELTGQTPHDFIRNIRLKQAAHLLSTADMNVTEVMYACGFSNSASFATIFKRFYGMTPREYKKS